jgi:guanine nucleotide-binding protein G(i) subunit alpha
MYNEMLLKAHSISCFPKHTGSGESGKSTIVKQMKIIHQNGYSSNELMVYRLTVLKNLLDSAQALVLALRKFNLEPEVSENRVSSGVIFCRGKVHD